MYVYLIYYIHKYIYIYIYYFYIYYYYILYCINVTPMYLHKILQALLYLTDRLLSKQQAPIQTTGSYPNDGLLSVLKYIQQTFTYRTADMNAEENDTKSL